MLSLAETERWERQFKEAVRYHGDECVGLAIGVRAVDVVLRELGVSDHRQVLEVRMGTKECLGDAFEVLMGLEKGRIEYVSPRTDAIFVRAGNDTVELHVTPTKVTKVADVFEKSDKELFPVIKKSKIHERDG